jgi:hypothetical protein
MKKFKPVKVNSKDIHKSYQERKGFQLFPKGKRNRLHPKFYEIDDMNCNFWYELQHRYFYIEYGENLSRAIISKDINYIVNTIKEDCHA